MEEANGNIPLEVAKENSGVIEESSVEAAEVRPSPASPKISAKTTHRKAKGRISRESRVRPEFDQKILTVRRVARVVAGGRRFNFSVCLVAGDRRGSVGVGVGKAADTSLAIDKALRDAKKSMIKVPLTKNHTIPHEVEAKYSSVRVLIKPSPGRGLAAGSAVRSVLELAGIRHAVSKILSPSKNKLNMARSAVEALRMLNPRQDADVT